jgi:hypothetical protein
MWGIAWQLGRVPEAGCGLLRMRGTIGGAAIRGYPGKDSLVKIETAPVLGYFAKLLNKARLAYVKFIAEGKRKVIRRIITILGIYGF